MGKRWKILFVQEMNGADDTALHTQPEGLHGEATGLKPLGQAAACKANIQRSVALTYTDNELSEREMKNTIPIKQ